MKLKVKKLHKDAIVPKYAHSTDSGMDLHSLEDVELKPFETKLIRTGIAIELPPNTEAQVRPRSGLALKNSITVLNSPGTIDEGYSSEVGIILINHSTYPYFIEKGMRIAQMVIAPVIRVEVQDAYYLKDSERGENGFGSTGV